MPVGKLLIEELQVLLRRYKLPGGLLLPFPPLPTKELKMETDEMVIVYIQVPYCSI